MCTKLRMTVPMHARRTVEVDGREVRLTPDLHTMTTLLLAAGPDKGVVYEQLMDALWPDPDYMPETWRGTLHTQVSKLRKCGVPVQPMWGRGFKIAEENRLDRPLQAAMPVAA